MRHLVLIFLTAAVSATAGNSKFYDAQCEVILDRASKVSSEDLKEFRLTAQMQAVVDASPHKVVMEDLLARANAGMPTSAFKLLEGKPLIEIFSVAERAPRDTQYERELLTRRVGVVWGLDILLNELVVKHLHSPKYHAMSIRELVLFSAIRGVCMYAALRYLAGSVVSKIDDKELYEITTEVREKTSGYVSGLPQLAGLGLGGLIGGVSVLLAHGMPPVLHGWHIIQGAILGYITGYSIFGPTPTESPTLPGAFKKPSMRTLTENLELAIRANPNASEAHYWQEELRVEGKPVRADVMLVLAPSDNGPQMLLLAVPEVIP